MKNQQNIVRNTVKGLAEQGYDFYCILPVQKECDTTTENVRIKVSAVQLSKAVLCGNRKDEVIVDCQRGRNGAKTATVISIPCFKLS